jgi:hypothetical protein
MSMLHGAAGRPVGDGGAVANIPDEAAQYLTDGVDLYRCLGAMASGRGEMVGLENCRSLDVVLLSLAELHARHLRTVIPAANGAQRQAAPALGT